MDVNDALIRVGEPRRYQLLLLLYVSLAGALTSMQTLVLVFTQADMGYRCREEQSSSSQSQEVWYNHTSNSTSGSMEYYSCSQTINNETSECTSFEYNSTIYSSTTISEFDLVCQRSWITTWSNVFFMMARIPCGFLSAQFTDRVGRKKAIIIGLFLLGGFGVANALAVNVEMYIVFKCLSSLPVIALWDSCATLLSEVTTPTKRPHILMGMIYSWGAGILLLSGFGYWLRDWRDLQLAISVPSFAILLASYWLFDESPHWLYSQGRYQEAQFVINKIARWNNIPSCEISPPKDEHHSKLDTEESVGPVDDVKGNKSENGCLQILRSKKTLINLAICAFGWLACNIGYTGLAFGVSSLAGDVYLNNLISGVTEFFAYAICFLVIPGGRKMIYVILMIVGGLGLIASAVVQDYLPNITWLIILTTMVGRLSLAAGWQILYLWCIELFPTTVRITMLEVSMVSGHVGSSVAPLINDLHKMIKDPSIHGKVIAPALYGVLLILSGILSLYLPETNNKALPVSLNDADIELPRIKSDKSGGDNFAFDNRNYEIIEGKM